MKYAPGRRHPDPGPSADYQKPNHLLLVLFIGSIGLHAILLFFLTDIYPSENTRVIELVVRGENTLSPRDIPTPRRRSLTDPPRLDRITPVAVPPPPPALTPIAVSAGYGDLPDSAAASINDAIDVPALPTAIKTSKPAAMPAYGAEGSDTRNSYLEMVRSRIEKFKRYPEQAKRFNMHGRVVISMVITLHGEVRSLKVAKSSGQKILDTAAISAVERAKPFPPPPSAIFKRNLLLNIPIVFEIT